MASVLDLAAFRAAPLTREPFEFLVLAGFIRRNAQDAIIRDLPRPPSGGSYPVAVLRYGPAFARLLEELNGPEMRGAFEEKFGIDLTGRPTMATVRGHSTERDGAIHTDSRSKIVTVLIYLNSSWKDPGGRLRLLRSADDLENAIVEIPPDDGTLVAFRRSENSFHGHTPYIGERRVLQFNWLTSAWSVRRELTRHRLSAWMKSIRSLGAA